MAASIKNIAMIHVSEKVAERIAERCVRAYLTARGENNFGSRMKGSTLRIYEMEVGDIIEVEATCKANLHGQFKTIRQKTGNDSLKWKCEQISPGKWRVERRENGSTCMFKRPYHNPKAVFLAEIPVGESMIYEGLPESNRICNDFTKNKARAILKDGGFEGNAEWRARNLGDNRIEITRLW